jgi:hypothetical protein
MDLLNVICVLGLCLCDVLFGLFEVLLQRVYLFQHACSLLNQFLLFLFESLSQLFLATLKFIR